MKVKGKEEKSFSSIPRSSQESSIALTQLEHTKPQDPPTDAEQPETACRCCDAPFRPFQTGFEFIESRHLGEKKLAAGDHIKPWRGKMGFYSHHAVVTPPIDAKHDAKFGIEDIFSSLSPSLTKQYISTTLKSENNADAQRIEEEVAYIVDTATPPYFIYKEDFTRREILRLWDSDVKPEYNNGITMSEGNAERYLIRELGLHSRTASEVCQNLINENADRVLRKKEIGRMWQLVIIGFDAGLAQQVMISELKCKRNITQVDSDVTDLTTCVLERTSFDSNFHNGHIKMWEIFCLCKYLEKGEDNHLEMKRADVVRFLSLADSDPFSVQRKLKKINSNGGPGEKYEGCTREIFKVNALKYVWRNFRRSINKHGMTRRKAKIFVVNMFENMENVHVMELLEKLPVNGCNHGSLYHPFDIIDLFSKITRRAEAVVLNIDDAKDYMQRELGVSQQTAGDILKEYCDVGKDRDNNDMLLANDLDNLLTIIKKMQPGVIQREKHAVVRSKLSFDHSKDILFKVTCPKVSKRSPEKCISTIEKEKCMTLPYNLKDLNCEVTCVKATLDPEKVIEEYCCIPGSGQVQRVKVGIGSRLLKALVFLFFRVAIPAILLNIQEYVHAIPAYKDWVGYVAIVAFEIVHVLMTVTCCCCWWCCSCGKATGTCELHPDLCRDKCLYGWLIFVQEVFLLGFGLGACFLFETYILRCGNDIWECLAVIGIYLIFAAIGFLFGRWLVFSCTYGYPQKCTRAECCRYCVLEPICHFRFCLYRCIRCCNICCTRDEKP